MGQRKQTILTAIGFLILIQITDTKLQKCVDFDPELNIPCYCSKNQHSGTEIDCDNVVFYRDLPVLPYRSNINSFSSRGSGIQDLSTLLFTASDIPLKKIDFSDNLVRRLAKRMFDGVEDTLEELYFAKNLLGDHLEATFETEELRKLRNLRILDLSSNGLKIIGEDIFEGLVNLEVSSEHISFDKY